MASVLGYKSTWWGSEGLQQGCPVGGRGCQGQVCVYVCVCVYLCVCVCTHLCVLKGLRTSVSGRIHECVIVTVHKATTYIMLI